MRRSDGSRNMSGLQFIGRKRRKSIMSFIIRNSYNKKDTNADDGYPMTAIWIWDVVRKTGDGPCGVKGPVRLVI